MRLAYEIVASFYGEEDAAQAQEAFVRLFQQRQVPEEMREFQLQPGQTILELLIAAGLVASKSEGRRLISQRGVRLDGEVLEDAALVLTHGGVLQVGKRNFLRLVS
jgi:tyrosyl-tRNA synthetase